jgi:hypothetical protein
MSASKSHRIALEAFFNKTADGSIQFQRMLGGTDDAPPWMPLIRLKRSPSQLITREATLAGRRSVCWEVTAFKSVKHCNCDASRKSAWRMADRGDISVILPPGLIQTGEDNYDLSVSEPQSEKLSFALFTRRDSLVSLRVCFLSFNRSCNSKAN